MVIGTWNVRRGDHWNLLNRVGADVLLLQEARRPPASRVADGRIHWEPFADSGRPWGTAIWSKAGGLRGLPASTSAVLAPTWPGTVAAAEMDSPSGGTLTLISVHAAGDTHPLRSNQDGYSVASLHHALSDVTGLLADRARHGRMRAPHHAGNRLILGGDLNVNPGWDSDADSFGHRNVLERIEAFGLKSVLEIRDDNRYATWKRARKWGQIDYVFVRDDEDVERAWVETDRAIEAVSDHRPVLAELAI